MKKNLFLTFCFSFIPGAGQMYQGYMKKGISLLTIFTAAIAISAMTNIMIFAIAIPLVLAYSFFDTYYLRNLIETQNQPEDKCIWNEEEISKLLGTVKIEKRNVILGICLIIVGIYVFLNSILTNIAYQMDITWLYELTSIIRRYTAPLILSALSIWLGTKFIIKNK